MTVISFAKLLERIYDDELKFLGRRTTHRSLLQFYGYRKSEMIEYELRSNCCNQLERIQV